MIVLSLFGSINYATADVIMPDTHAVQGCTKLTNLNEYPDIIFIGYITGPMPENREKGYDTYIIKEGDCLHKGYKFNTLFIIALKKSYVDKVGIDNINLSINHEWWTSGQPKFEKGTAVISESIDFAGGWYEDSNPLIKENFDYKIAGISGNKLILYKSQETQWFNNDSPEKTETFSQPEIQNLKELNSTNIPDFEPDLWQKISTFFAKLFGRD